jgi:hypothetical protein
MIGRAWLADGISISIEDELVPGVDGGIPAQIAQNTLTGGTILGL